MYTGIALILCDPNKLHITQFKKKIKVIYESKNYGFYRSVCNRLVSKF